MEQIIQVGVRVRPINDREVPTRCCIVDESKATVLMNSSTEACHFDFVGGENCSQKNMFSTVGLQLVQSCLEGKTATLFAYGQTGSGKTYTIFGNYNPKRHEITEAGILPRSLQLLYQKKSPSTPVSISMFQIYNDVFYDLINDGRKCEVKPDINGSLVL